MNKQAKNTNETTTTTNARRFAMISVALIIIGCVTLNYAEFHVGNPSSYGYQTVLKALLHNMGIFITLAGWLVAISLVRIQKYQYLPSAIARQFSRGRVPLDERQLQVRRLAFEQSYSLITILTLVAGFWLLFFKHGIQYNYVWFNRPLTWVLLNLIVLFMFLPSLVAARYDQNQSL